MKLNGIICRLCLHSCGVGIKILVNLCFVCHGVAIQFKRLSCLKCLNSGIRGFSAEFSICVGMLINKMKKFVELVVLIISDAYWYFSYLNSQIYCSLPLVPTLPFC